MNRPPEHCVMCARFQIAGHEAAAARGEGWCSSWEAYKPWNGQAGVLFMRSRHETERRALGEKLAHAGETISRASAPTAAPT
jgi:hypothetical protein